MAIEQLLQALEDEQRNEQAAGAASSEGLALLRARLTADFSEALAGTESEPRADEGDLLNELAAHLDGLSLGAEREKFIAALARSRQNRAALESAARFLADLTREAAPVSSTSLNEAMAVFGPTEPRAAAAMAPRLVGGRGFNWQAWGAMAAVLLVGVIGGAQLWQLVRMSAHAPVAGSAPMTSAPSARMQVPTAVPAPNAAQGEITMQRPNPTAAVAPPPRALAPSQADCDAALPPEGTDHLAKAAATPAANDGANRHDQAALRRPCHSLTGVPTASPVPRNESRPTGMPSRQFKPQHNLLPGGDQP